ncbi:MAG: hypothetical protein R3C99_07800 [Pirellulaceae bacterium]
MSYDDHVEIELIAKEALFFARLRCGMAAASEKKSLPVAVDARRNSSFVEIQLLRTKCPRLAAAIPRSVVAADVLLEAVLNEDLMNDLDQTRCGGESG